MIRHMKGTPTERLKARLTRTQNGCLEWTGGVDRGGYGRIYIARKPIGAHRFAWTLANGPVPDGLHVLHHCDNPPCCQTDPTEGYPDGHLFVGTNAENVADMIAKGRRHVRAPKTRCPQKHAYDEANTYVDSRGFPHCRACNRAARVRYQAKKVQL